MENATFMSYAISKGKCTVLFGPIKLIDVRRLMGVLEIHNSYSECIHTVIETIFVFDRKTVGQTTR